MYQCTMPLSFPICPILHMLITTLSHIFKVQTLFLKQVSHLLMTLQQHNNMNTQEVDNFHGFLPMSGDNFSDHHRQRSHPLSFLSPQDGIDTFQSISLMGDHQFNSNYDPMNHFPTMVDMFGVQPDGVEPRGESSFMISDPPVFDPGFIGETYKGHGGKKRKKTGEYRVEKPREVVHVRAKRGEATDSHSLAERTRREKINEKLRRLQDLVPGCYKTMGMSVMLDVIINYVRSLQNQIEFLSMKLSAASMFYDFNSTEIDACDMGIMKGTNGDEAQMMMERMMVGEGYGEFPRFQTT